MESPAAAVLGGGPGAAWGTGCRRLWVPAVAVQSVPDTKVTEAEHVPFPRPCARAYFIRRLLLLCLSSGPPSILCGALELTGDAAAAAGVEPRVRRHLSSGEHCWEGDARRDRVLSM